MPRSLASVCCPPAGRVALLAGALVFKIGMATGMCQAPTPVARASLRTSPPLLLFQQQDGRLVATVQPPLLEADFLIRGEVLAATSDTAAASQPAGSVPDVGSQWISEALRLRLARDSVLLWEHTGTAGGQLQYRIRAAMPVLHRTPAGAVTVDAEPLWAALKVKPTWSQSTDSGLRFRSRYPDATTATRASSGHTVLYQVGVLQLPKTPMRPRFADPRINFSTSAPGDTSPQRIPNGRYIRRHRLEKKDPTVAVSDVVHPIIVQLEGVPARWLPYVKQGVEEWNPVFEAIGFRNAVVVRSPDDARRDSTQAKIRLVWIDDLEWSAEADIYKRDPRSGEVLAAEIKIGTGLIAGLNRRYFAFVGAHHPDARRWPLPDSITGGLITAAVLHEMAHTLGLRHNFKADGYPTDSLRRPSFVHRMGFRTSATSYAAFNYVAQPEDQVAIEDFRPRIGPYDRWAIAWGYGPIPDAATPEAELPTLEQWRKVQDTTSYLRSSLVLNDDNNLPQNTLGLPYEQSEIVGDDLLKSVEYGVRNLARLSDMTRQDTTPEVRDLVVEGWLVLMRDIPQLLGGEVPQAPYPRDLSKVELQPIDLDYQLRTVRFMLAHLLYGRDELVQRMLASPPKDSLALILFDSLTPEWKQSQNAMRVRQQNLLRKLLNMERLARFAAQVSPAQHTLPPALCQDLTTLNQQLSTAAADASVPARREQAGALQRIVASVVDPSVGLCK